MAKKRTATTPIWEIPIGKNASREERLVRAMVDKFNEREKRAAGTSDVCKWEVYKHVDGRIRCKRMYSPDGTFKDALPLTWYESTDWSEILKQLKTYGREAYYILLDDVAREVGLQ